MRLDNIRVSVSEHNPNRPPGNIDLIDNCPCRYILLVNVFKRDLLTIERSADFDEEVCNGQA
jgi:hypothetical protein